MPARLLPARPRLTAIVISITWWAISVMASSMPSIPTPVPFWVRSTIRKANQLKMTDSGLWHLAVADRGVSLTCSSLPPVFRMSSTASSA
jgi:hypothetical protein